MIAVRPRVLFLFLDGVGIGRRDPLTNPFFAASLPNLRALLDGSIPDLYRRRIVGDHAVLTSLSATLSVDGLPQSGTGQTALLTGANAARMIGKHFGPYPYSTLRSVIAETNIFRRLRSSGRGVLYANAYPERYLHHLAAYPTRITATVMAWLSLGEKLSGLAEVRAELALAADITNERWVQLGFGAVPIISPRVAGRRLARLSERFDFLMYEYFFTDHAGHSQSMDQAVGTLCQLDELIAGIVESLDLGKTLLIVTSDHGNLEDLSTKKHTRNPVPLLVVGAHREEFAARCTRITHITPAIIDLLT